MKIRIFENDQQLANAAASDIAGQLTGSDMLLCFPAGDTPTKTIEKFVKLVKHDHIDMAGKRFVTLDEWVGVGTGDEGGCYNYLKKHLYAKLGIAEENICAFDGVASNLEAECARMDAFIEQFGPIDIAVLGIGLNGHVGFNERSVSPDLRVHVVDLDEITIKVSEKYFKPGRQVRQGITLGLKSLLQAKQVILLAAGANKSSIIKEALEGPVTNETPASLLRTHSNFHVYLDEEAASCLNSTDGRQ